MAVGCNPCLCPSQVTWPLFNSLQGFWPGMQLLVGEREMALDTMRAFHALWRHLGFHPEGFNLASMQVQPGQLGYPLRPEHVESLFWAHRTTHGGEWLRAGRDVLRSLQTLRVPCGVVCLSDVANRTREDNMESFFLSETTKYLYLLFDPDDEVYEHGKYVFTTEAHILPLDLYNLTGDQEAVEGEAAEVAEALRQLGSDYDDDEETNEEQEGRGGGEGGEGQEEEEEGAREGGQPANGAAAAAGGGAARLALHGGCAMPSYKHLLGFYGNAPHGSNSQVEIEEALKGQQRQQQQQQQEGQQQGQQPQAAGGAAAGGAAAPAQEASRDPSAELAVRRGALLGLSHRTVQQPAAQTGRGAAGVALDEAIHQLEEAGRRPGGAASAEVEQRQRRVAQEQRRVDEEMGDEEMGDEEMGDEEMGDEETVAEQAQCHPLDTGCGGSMWCRRSTPRAWPPWSWRRSGRRHYGWGSLTRPRSAACAATWREAVGRLATTWACGAAASPRMPTTRTPPHPAPHRRRFPTPRPRSPGCCQTAQGFPTPLACPPAAAATRARWQRRRWLWRRWRRQRWWRRGRGPAAARLPLRRAAVKAA